MKIKTFSKSLPAILVIPMFLFGCKDSGVEKSFVVPSSNTEETYPLSSDLETFSVNTPYLSVAEMIGIVENLKNRDGFGIIDDSVLITNAIRPLVENGRLLHIELVSKLEDSNQWLLLSDETKDSILNMTDLQLAQLSFIYSIFNTDFERDAINRGMSADVIKDCIGVVLGLNGLKDIYYSITAGHTYQSAIKLLQWIGKRYLSYALVAWMVWDFINCVS